MRIELFHSFQSTYSHSVVVGSCIVSPDSSCTWLLLLSSDVSAAIIGCYNGGIVTVDYHVELLFAFFANCDFWLVLFSTAFL